MPNTISAVIVTYNRKDVLCQAIESVLSQTKPVNEIIVVDDGSTDGSEAIIRKAFGSAIRIIRQPNRGVGYARRTGIDAANGSWIAFLDSDDKWNPKKIELQSDALCGLPEDVVWLFGNAGLINDNGFVSDFFSLYDLAMPRDLTIIEDIFPLCFPHFFPMLPGSLIKKDVMKQVNAFCEGLRCGEDFLLAMQLGLRGKFAATSETVFLMNRTGNVIEASTERRFSQTSEFYRAYLEGLRLWIETKGGSQLIRHYEDFTRGLCIAMLKEGKDGVLRSCLDQFRYRVTTKSSVFSLCVLTGAPGTRAWQIARGLKAKLMRENEPDPWEFRR